MTHWREPHSWKRGLDSGMFEGRPITDCAVFFLTVACALLVAFVGWWVS